MRDELLLAKLRGSGCQYVEGEADTQTHHKRGAKPTWPQPGENPYLLGLYVDVNFDIVRPTRSSFPHETSHDIRNAEIAAAEQDFGVQHTTQVLMNLLHSLNEPKDNKCKASWSVDRSMNGSIDRSSLSAHLVQDIVHSSLIHPDVKGVEEHLGDCKSLVVQVEHLFG